MLRQQLWPGGLSLAYIGAPAVAFLEKEGAHYGDSCSGPIQAGLLQCALHGDALEDNAEIAADTKCQFICCWENLASFIEYLFCRSHISVLIFQV